MTIREKTYINGEIKMEKKQISCRSEWNIVFVGVLTQEMIFERISDFITHIKPLSVFKDNINFHSHETLLFKEKYIPFIYDILGEIDSFVEKRVKIFTRNGHGLITLTDEPLDKEEINYIFLSKNVLCSDIEGMKFLKRMNINKVVIRSEFLNDEIPKKEFLIKTLNFATNIFDEVIFRFTDANNESIIGERGSSALLSSRKDILMEELECASKYNNLSVLCPYVRDEDEAIKIYHHIRNVFSGAIGCMIEVPLIIYEGEKIAQCFDFFVLGISDLAQLLQGTDRNIHTINYSTVQFIAELLERYFMPYISEDKKIYITYRPLFEMLKLKNSKLNFLYLTK